MKGRGQLWAANILGVFGLTVEGVTEALGLFLGHGIEVLQFIALAASSILTIKQIIKKEKK